MSLNVMCTTGSEDAVTVQAGTFSWIEMKHPFYKSMYALHTCYYSIYYIALIVLQLWLYMPTSNKCSSFYSFSCSHISMHPLQIDSM